MSDQEDDEGEKVIELKTTKKPKKKMSEENLAKLALARIKAGEAKRANMEIRHLQKENNKLEKQEEVAKIKEKNAKLKAPKEPKIEPVKEVVEVKEAITDTEDEPEIIRKVVKKKKKKQVIIVQSSTDDESEEEKVIYIKKPKKKKEVQIREPTPEELQVLINQEKAKTEPIPIPTREEAITEIRKQQSGMFNNPFHNKRYGRAF